MSAFRTTFKIAGLCVGILSAVLSLGPGFRPAASAFPATSDTFRVAQSGMSLPDNGLAEVTGVAFQNGRPGETFIDITTSSPVTYHILQLQNPPRLVVDLERAHKSILQKSFPVFSTYVKQVRVSQFQAKDSATVRVVVDLNGSPAFDVHSSPSGVRIELRPAVMPPPSASSAVSQGPGRPAQPTPSATTGQAPPGAAQPPAVPTPPPPPSAPTGPNVLYRRLPFNSLSQNEKLLDSLGLRIVLSFDYRKGGADEATWRTKGVQGVIANRLFIKPLGAESYRTVELAISPSAQGGYEMALYGEQVAQGARGSNPDLAGIQQLTGTEITRTEQTPPAGDLNQLAYQTYYLSYVVADHAIALLKTMGYTTVEYNESAGESVYEKIYNPIKLGTGKPPIIVKLIDSTKTSIMEPLSAAPGQMAVAVPQAAAPAAAVGAATPATYSGVPAIGGNFLHQMTSGEPQQRLLILYNKDDPDSMQSLLNLLQGTVDVPSREIMIEALVIELNSTKARTLGITFTAANGQSNVISTDVSEAGAALPFIYSFNNATHSVYTFSAALTALLNNKQAEILSNPSVLVLDDRQARIQIGQQVPVVKAVSTAAGIISSVDYFPVGIVLNLRPRISEDGSEITMQAETIVSALAASTQVAGTAALVAPVVNNREVQSIVRVADNTPFIIAGLISNNDTTQVIGIPWLADIPVLGALFRRTSLTKERQEVIIVVTPHVVPLEDRYFSYVIPKDSEQFDRFNYKLFRNGYRIRGDDLFDLEFIYDSNVYKDLVSRVTAASAADPQLRESEPFASILKGGAPGEDIFVRRMLWEIIRKTNYARFLEPSRIIFYKNNPSAVGGAGFQLAFLSQELSKLKGDQNALALTYEAQPKASENSPFVLPKAEVSYTSVNLKNYPEMLVDGNKLNPDGTPQDWEILLSKEKLTGLSVSPLELLQGVIVLKRLLELNRSMPLSLKEFHVGREILFPSQEEMQRGYHLVDREVAKLFYEVYNYYPAFEQEFNRQARRMNAMLGNVHRQ